MDCGTSPGKCAWGQSVNCTIDDAPVRIFGSDVDRLTASYLITASDIAVAFVLLVTILAFYIKITLDEANYQTKHIQIQGYTVHVAGLPIDTTREEIMEHFNSRYRLDEDLVHMQPKYCRFCPLQHLVKRKKPKFKARPISVRTCPRAGSNACLHNG